jgi:hypothetical protein
LSILKRYVGQSYDLLKTMISMKTTYIVLCVDAFPCQRDLLELNLDRLD